VEKSFFEGLCLQLFYARYRQFNLANRDHSETPIVAVPAFFFICILDPELPSSLSVHDRQNPLGERSILMPLFHFDRISDIVYSMQLVTKPKEPAEISNLPRFSVEDWEGLGQTSWRREHSC
jgi:hypothetical protein